MLRWLNQFTNKSSDDYFKLGGARSFHKFKYSNVNIILIGEIHQNMPWVLADQYSKVMNEFTTKANNLKIYIENDTNRVYKPSIDEIGFIDLMSNIKSSDNVQIIHADKRTFEQGFVDFYLFLNNIAKAENEVIEAYREHKKTPPVPTPFFQTPEFTTHIKTIPIFLDYDMNYTLSDLYKFVNSQIEILDKLASKYSKENKLIYQYIAACLLELNDGLKIILDLEDKYIKMRKDINEKQIKNLSIIDICIDMLEKSGSFQHAADWLKIIDLYVIAFLDATLIANIWDEIKTSNENNNKTIMFVTGDIHTKNLVPILKEICEVETSNYADKNGKIIPPHILSEYLNDNFEHSPDKQTCLVM